MNNKGEGYVCVCMWIDLEGGVIDSSKHTPFWINGLAFPLQKSQKKVNFFKDF